MKTAFFVSVLVAIASACSGAAVSALYYRNEISSMQLESATARANQGKRDYEKLVAAQDALAVAESERIRLDKQLARMRNSGRDTRQSASTCTVEREAVARCERLLREGADLVGEGGDLLQRNASLHDSLAELK